MSDNDIELKWKAKVDMKKSWTSRWVNKPTEDDVIEAMRDVLIDGDPTKLATTFDITISKVTKHG